MAVEWGRPGWKLTYEDVLWSKAGPPLKLRGLLHALLRLSDPLGRVWWGQAALAEHAGCSERTLRRLLPQLAAAGYLRIEAMTFKKLALAQAALGFPLPDRSDEGHAPDLLTLLHECRPAAELPAPSRPRSRRPGLVRAVPPGQGVQGEPRTDVPARSAYEATNAMDRMTADPRDLSALDVHTVEGDPGSVAPPLVRLDVPEKRDARIPPSEPLSGATTDGPTDADAWRALSAAYDRHFQRAYHARPTNKRLSRDAEAQMAGHLADMAKLLQARLVERQVDLATLPRPPLELLADEALRVWFDSPGTNDYLRRVSHRVSALPDDLPFRVRKASEELLVRHAPKPEPRRAPAAVVALVSATVGRRTPPAPPPPVFPVPAQVLVRPPKPPVAKVNLPLDTVRVLDGLSARRELAELGEHASLASELLALARERGAGPERVLDALDAANEACARLKVQTASAKTSAVYKAVIEALQKGDARCGGTS